MALVKKKTNNGITVLEKECKLLDMKHKNNVLLLWLLQLGSMHPNIMNDLERSLALRNIKPPARPTSSGTNSQANSRPESPRISSSRGSMTSSFVMSTSAPQTANNELINSRGSTSSGRVQVMSLDFGPQSPPSPKKSPSKPTSRHNSRPTSASKLPSINNYSSPPMSPSGLRSPGGSRTSTAGSVNGRLEQLSIRGTR